MRKAILYGLGLFLVSVLVLTAGLYFSRLKIAEHLIENELRTLLKTEVDFQLHSQDLRQLRFDLRVPKYDLRMEDWKLNYEVVQYFPLALNASFKEQFDSFSDAKLNMQDIRIDFSLSYRSLLDSQANIQIAINRLVIDNLQLQQVRLRATKAGMDIDSQVKLIFEQHPSRLRLQGKLLLTNTKNQFKGKLNAKYANLLQITKQNFEINWSQTSETQLLLSCPKTDCVSISHNKLEEDIKLQASKVDMRLDSEMNNYFTKARLSVKDLITELEIDSKGSLKNKTLHAQIKTKTKFHPTRFQGQKYHKKLKEFLVKPKGSLSSLTRVQIENNKVKKSYSKIELANFFVEVKKIPISSANLQLEFSSLFPLETKGTQVLRIQKIGDRTPLKSIELDAQLKNGDHFFMDHFSARWSKAFVSASKFDTSLTKPVIRTKLRMEDLNLEVLLNNLAVPSLSGQGLLSGILPIFYEHERIVIPRARLLSNKPGIIRYKDPSLKDVPQKIESLSEFNSLVARGQQALVFKALDNFHYDKFSLHIWRKGPNDLGLEAQLEGSNPDLVGAPFKITIPFTGDLEAVLMESLARAFVEEDSWEDYYKKIRSNLF